MRPTTAGSPSHELDAPPWLRVESTLMATAQAIRDAYDTKLAPLGLTLSLASLLAYVADFGPVSQTRAAEHLGQGRASTGAQVDRLEQLDPVHAARREGSHLRKRAGEADRRSANAERTGDGEATHRNAAWRFRRR